MSAQPGRCRNDKPMPMSQAPGTFVVIGNRAAYVHRSIGNWCHHAEICPARQPLGAMLLSRAPAAQPDPCRGDAKARDP